MQVISDFPKVNFSCIINVIHWSCLLRMEKNLEFPSRLKVKIRKISHLSPSSEIQSHISNGRFSWDILLHAALSMIFPSNCPRTFPGTHLLTHLSNSAECYLQTQGQWTWAIWLLSSLSVPGCPCGIISLTNSFGGKSLHFKISRAILCLAI